MMEATHGLKVEGKKRTTKNVEKEFEELLEAFSRTRDINDNSVKTKLELTQELIFKSKKTIDKILIGLENIKKMPISFREIFYEVNTDGSFSPVFRRYNGKDSDDVFRDLIDRLPNTSRTISTLSKPKYNKAVNSFRAVLQQAGKITDGAIGSSDLEKFSNLTIALADWMEIVEEEELEGIGNIYDTIGNDAFERDSAGQLNEVVDTLEEMWEVATPEMRVKFRKMIVNAEIQNHDFPVEDGKRRRIELSEEI